MRKIASLLACLFLLLFISGCTADAGQPSNSGNREADNNLTVGQIYLYGEMHGYDNIFAEELRLWQDCYNEQNMRHLFVELPYYTAEYLNVWLQAADDTILEAIYEDWQGTALYDSNVRDFYQAIKTNCPETVFHGTDVGHQYSTTGQRYLDYLTSIGQEDSQAYQLAQANIEQGKYYYDNSDNNYRENMLVENFVREYEQLGGAAVMGIYGAYHVGRETVDEETGLPCMANQLGEIYGEALHCEDISWLAIDDIPPEKIESLTVDGREYQAAYFGEEDLTGWVKDYTSRRFWRLEEAYPDFKDKPTNGDVLPYNNYPTRIEIGQVFMIEFTKIDNTTELHYFRSDGDTYQGMLTTVEFTLE